MYNLKKESFSSFQLYPVVLALFTSFDVGGAPNSQRFNFITPLQSILERSYCKEMLQGRYLT